MIFEETASIFPRLVGAIFFGTVTSAAHRDFGIWAHSVKQVRQDWFETVVELDPQLLHW